MKDSPGNTFTFIEDYEEIDDTLGDIIYDETFTTFLHDNDCYDEYLHNIVSQSRGYHYGSFSWIVELHGSTTEDINEFLNRIYHENKLDINYIDFPYEFLLNETFQWENTKEGPYYWADICARLRTLIRTRR